MVASSLGTERLVLRMFRDEDLDAYAAFCADPYVMRFLGDGRPMSRSDAWRHMAMLVGHWSLRGYGMWAVEERSTGALVGRIGLHRPEGWPGGELGWTLAREHWGRGFATEGARAALEYAFGELGWKRVISLIHPENRASIRVAERLGEHVEGRITLFGNEALVYALDRSDSVSSV